ncbi:MAG: MarR family transcriptional regulator [Lachnospiraceae bacterium]|nr:MarR family transcriptional regulator [Lachnospiraceae bacterium]
MADKYQCLKLDNQLCFPLYAVSKEIVRKYKPFLDEVDLTYTQYIVMMVVWEEEQVSVKEMGKKLFLDSGTLTPVLKTLEKKGLIERTRSKEDERNLIVTLTPSGKALKDKAVKIPAQIGGCLNISPEDAVELHKILHKIMETL